MLDIGARDWLSQIEADRTALAVHVEQLAKERKRLVRTASAKSATAALAKVAELEQLVATKTKALDSETLLFFNRVFNVDLHKPIAVQAKNGTVSQLILASQFIARQLSNGFGVFYATGDSMVKDVHKGLPKCVLLTADESLGQQFVDQT